MKSLHRPQVHIARCCDINIEVQWQMHVVIVAYFAILIALLTVYSTHVELTHVTHVKLNTYLNVLKEITFTTLFNIVLVKRAFE